MFAWENFEIKCVNYLNDKFGAYAHFTHQGGANSTIPDILVTTKSDNSFYIDAKHSPAQCGQFVLIPNIKSRVFEYSNKNINRINKYSEMIMEYMNSYFDEFRESGTVGKAIDMPSGSDIFSDWIIHTYEDKGVKFFITNDYTILPIQHFCEYFDVAAKYRIKRSGSGNVGKSRFSTVIKYIKSHNYLITDFYTVGDKLFISSPLKLHNKRFIIGSTEYMFSARSDKYEVRKLSNTYNANVIFSIKYKSSAVGMTDNDFIDYLK